MSGDSERITGNSDITRLGKSCRPSGSWPDQSMQGRFGGNLRTLRLCFRFARHPSAIGGRVLMDLPTSHSVTSERDPPTLEHCRKTLLLRTSPPHRWGIHLVALCNCGDFGKEMTGNRAIGFG